MHCTRCKTRPASYGFKQCAECRAYVAANLRALRAREPERMAAYQREWHRRQRETVIAHYGGRCACCGEDEFAFLALDHKDGGGTKHRNELGKRGNDMVRWAITNGLPPIFRVLCHNCNQAIGFYGRCPHETAVLRLVRGEETA